MEIIEKNIKNFYSGILLFFIIETLIDIFSISLTVVIAMIHANNYIILAGELFFYITIIYVVLYQMKSVPQITLWVIVPIFIFSLMPKTFLYSYILDIDKYVTAIYEFERFERLIFKLIFVFLIYIKYVNQSLKSSD